MRRRQPGGSNIALRSIGRRGAAWLSDDQAASTVEYAVLIAAIACGLWLAADSIRLAAEDSFSSVAKRLADRSSPAPQSEAASSDGAPRATFVALSKHPFVAYARLAASVMMLSAIGMFVCWRARRRRHIVEAPPIENEAAATSHTTARYVAKRQRILRLLSRHSEQLRDRQLCVRHLMTDRPTSVPPLTKVDQLAALMEQGGMRHVLVCSRHGELVGVISDRDLKKPGAQTAADVMTRDPLTVSPETSIVPAMTMMLDRHINCLPVVDGKRVLGILTTTDLVMALQCTMHLIHQLAHDASHDALSAATE